MASTHTANVGAILSLINPLGDHVSFVFQDIESIQDFGRHTVAIGRDLYLYVGENDHDIIEMHLRMLMHHYKDGSLGERTNAAVEFFRGILSSIDLAWIRTFDLYEISEAMEPYEKEISDAVNAMVEKLRLLL